MIFYITFFHVLQKIFVMENLRVISNAPASERYKYLEPELNEPARISYSAPRINKYDNIIREAAEAHGLRFGLLKAVIHVESGSDP